MDDFEQRVLKIMPNLRSYALSLSVSAADAEDLLHDCLEKLFAKKTQWRGGNFKSWSMTIMTNLFKNKLRKKSNRPPTIAIDDVQIADKSQMSDVLVTDKIKAAIDQLPEKNRTVLMLVVIENYKYSEIAEMLEIPIGTVMSRLSRARKAISEILTGQNIVSFRRPK